MTYRFLNWPPLREAFAVLDSRTCREYKMEIAVDIIQAVQDGPDRALKFYNFVCSVERKRRFNALNNSKADREIISFYVDYHHLLSRNETTASNALIGTWQKKLGHQSLWIDFNLEYQRGPRPASDFQPARRRSVRASARKSTGCIPTPKPVNRQKSLPRRKSAGYRHFSDPTLAPPQSSKGEDDILPSNGHSLGSTDQSVPDNHPSHKVHMGTADEPPPTPPLDIDALIDPLNPEPEISCDSLTEVLVHGSVDDPMDGASASAARLRSETEPMLSVTGPNSPKSLSAPVPPSSSGPRRKTRKRNNYYAKGKPSKRKMEEPAEETEYSPMAVDTPTVGDPGPEPEPPIAEPVHQDIFLSEPLIPLLEPLAPPTPETSIALVPPIAPEIRVPLSTAYTNVTSAPAPNVDTLPTSLENLSNTPVAAVPGSFRPPLPSNPPIWAQSRQELCETCDFFKSYQGGVYYSNGYAKGYLLSCFGAMRDIWQDGGRLIISHGGGKAASKELEADHQSFKDFSVRALVKNWQTKEPLVLIADDKYEHFPFDLTKGRDGGRGYAYVVLGYYFIRNFWAEKHPADNAEGCAVRFKFAFQYCGEGDPWWVKCVGFPSAIMPPPATNGFQNVHDMSCFSCGKTSPRIYEQGWMCLWPTCEFHFQLCDSDATTALLTYTEAFLAARPNPKTKRPAVRIPEPVLEAKNGIVTTPLFHHGWHCRRCGRLSCRTKWEQWECSSCGVILPVKGKIRDHREFWGLSPNQPFETCDVNPVSGITKIAGIRDQLGAFTFIFPHNRGKIHLITGSARYNTETNHIFKRFQEHANNGNLPFRRFPMKAHVCRGEFLTNYFSQNSGEPYQYVGAADKTLPFDQCPPCVLQALELIRTRAAIMLGERPPFNELLTAAYMEKQSMGFHTDGERGLGPIVASLSMGSPAIMKFRTLEDKKTVVLTLVLRHGDVVVMEGARIQAVYEHTVCPIGFRIAVTAREIRPENWTQGAWR